MIIIFNTETEEVIPSFTCPAPPVDQTLVFAGEIKLRFPKSRGSAEVSQEIWGLVRNICSDKPVSIFENALISDGCDYLFIGKVYSHKEVVEA